MKSVTTGEVTRAVQVGRAALAALGVLLLAACARSQAAPPPQQPPPPQVAVARVLVKRLQDWQDFSGRLEAVNAVELRPRVAGHIESVRFVEGARV